MKTTQEIPVNTEAVGTETVEKAKNTKTTNRKMQVSMTMLHAFEGNPKVLNAYIEEVDRGSKSELAFAVAIATVRRMETAQ